LVKTWAKVKVFVYQSKSISEQKDLESISGSLADKKSLLELCSGADVVFHLAARITLDNRDENDVIVTNVTGTKNLLDAAIQSGVGKFIHFSSIDAFKKPGSKELLNEDCQLIQTKESVYAYSKAESEREVLKAAKHGFDTIIISPTAVIGPYDVRASIIGNTLRKIVQNQMPFLVSGSFNWVDVRDVAQAAMEAAKHGKSGEKYIISGHFCNLRDLSLMISKISGCRVPIFIPAEFVKLFSPLFTTYSRLTNTEPLFTRHSLDLLINSPTNISNEKAGRELNYIARPLEDTLKDTIKWYKENKLIN